MKTLALIFINIFLVFSVKSDDVLNIKQFTPKIETEIYNPENLFEYIDGGADIFLSYGFQQLYVRDFAFDSLQFSVELYNMGTPLNAFGIYKSERPQNDSGLKIGAEAVISPPYQAIMLKGVYYIKINTYEGKLDSTLGAQILKAVSDVIGGEEKFPEQLNLLPATNKIAGSEGYVREAFLGVSSLNRCLFASYQASDSSLFKVFLLLPDAQETAKMLWEKLAKKWRSEQFNSREILLKKIPYKGIAAVAEKHNFIYGVADCETIDQAKKRLTLIMDRIEK